MTTSEDICAKLVEFFGPPTSGVPLLAAVFPDGFNNVDSLDVAEFASWVEDETGLSDVEAFVGAQPAAACSVQTLVDHILAGRPVSTTAFEKEVLRVISSLGADAYGVPIGDAVAAATGYTPSTGRLYGTLDRLERLGLVTSRMGEGTPERGGYRKRFFTLTSKGVTALDRK